MEVETGEVMKEREIEKICEELRKEGSVANMTIRERIAAGVAAAMVRKAKELAEEGVIVEAPLEARQAVAAASCKKKYSRSPSGRVWKSGA
eukprot:3287688-Karenia_brevis.AAC.1